MNGCKIVGDIVEPGSDVRFGHVFGQSGQFASLCILEQFGAFLGDLLRVELSLGWPTVLLEDGFRHPIYRCRESQLRFDKQAVEVCTVHFITSKSNSRLSRRRRIHISSSRYDPIRVSKRKGKFGLDVCVKLLGISERREIDAGR